MFWKKLNRTTADLSIFSRMNEQAFPSYERWAFSEMIRFTEETDCDLWGVYEEGCPVGFALFLKNHQCGYLYYLCVQEEHQSKGYGRKMLKHICEYYASLPIILDFEELDAKAENRGQRIRRRAFYLRNGFYETGHYTLLNGGRFEVVCTDPVFPREGFQDLLYILHAHRPGFPDQLYTYEDFIGYRAQET